MQCRSVSAWLTSVAEGPLASSVFLQTAGLPPSQGWGVPHHVCPCLECVSRGLRNASPAFSLIRSSVRASPDCCPGLVIVSTGAPLWDSGFVSSGYSPEVGLLGLVVFLVLISWGSSTRVPTVAAPVYVPTSGARACLFCIFLPASAICCIILKIYLFILEQGRESTGGEAEGER